MKEQQILPISIERYLSVYPTDSALDSELVLSDFASFAFPEEARKMQCVFVGLCLQGSANYTIAGIDHQVKANDVIIILEGQTVSNIRASEDFMGEVMLITHSLLDDVISDVRNTTNLFVFAMEHPVFPLSSVETRSIVEYTNLMEQRLKDHSHLYRREIVGTILATLIYELSNAIRRTQADDISANNKSERVFRDFISLVGKNFREQRRVSWYGEQLGLSSKNLLEMVKRVSHRTPNDWLDTYVTMEIRHLLHHTNLSIKEIAEQLCFSNQGSMGKFFKEQVGMSPKNYRTL